MNNVKITDKLKLGTRPSESDAAHVLTTREMIDGLRRARESIAANWHRSRGGCDKPAGWELDAIDLAVKELERREAVGARGQHDV